jgi:hypothetical protein
MGRERMRDDANGKRLAEAIRSYIADMPDDYGERVATLIAFRAAVQREFALGLQPSFNLLLANHPKGSPVDARTLAKRLDHDLASLGLAIVHPDSDTPARLAVASTPASDERHGWLQLEPIDDAVRSRPLRLPSPLPTIELTACPPGPRSTHRLKS